VPFKSQAQRRKFTASRGREAARARGLEIEEGQSDDVDEKATSREGESEMPERPRPTAKKPPTIRTSLAALHPARV
jgi:hypothetical protein